MKKFTLLFVVIFIFQSALYAQFEVTGSDDFGRLFDVTYDANVPNKVYAVTLGNHIVVSEDNGASWDILYSLFIGQGASIRDLKLSPNGTALTFSAYLPNSSLNEIRIYDIATAAIVKSFPLPNRMDSAYVTSYDFYDGDTDILLVDTNFPVGMSTEGKTFYTADGGNNWNMIYYTNDHDTVFLNDVAISPNNPDKIFLTRGNGSTGVDGGLFVSEDAGQTWEEKLPGIILDPISFDPANHQHVLMGTGISFGGTVENLYKSIDGGENFNIVPITWTAGILDCINVISFNENNPSQIIVLEENEIAISEDGGNTWENFVYPDDDPQSYYYGLQASYNPQNSEEIFISANYVPLFSSDGGETLSWSKSPYFVSTGNIDMYLNGANANLYYGVQFGYVHRDLNTGTDTPYDIVPLNIFSNTPGQTQYADKITPNRVYTFSSSFMGSSLRMSNDNGATESELLMIFANRLTAVATFPNAPQTILAAFGGFEPSETQLKRIDFSDINNISVTDITLPSLDYIHEILIDATGKIIMPVGIEVYSSMDGGTTWTNNSSGLDVLGANDLIFDLQRDALDNNRMALASSKGIFMSEDGGENWMRKTTSLVFNVAFSTETEGAMMASTYSSEFSEFTLHYSTDGGETWASINNEQLLGIGSGSSAYLFGENSVTAFIGSFDLGLVEYTVDLNVAGIPDSGNGDKEIAIYPNPASEVLNISLKNSRVNRVTLYTLSGAKVLDREDTSTVDISDLAVGTYLVRVLDSNRKLFFKKIVKQ